MGFKVLDERTDFAKAIINDDRFTVVQQLLNCLKKASIGLRTVIELGAGANAKAAAAFLEEGMNYCHVDIDLIGAFNNDLMFQLKQKKCSKRCIEGMYKKLRTEQREITKMDINRSFGNIERPLLVLFYSSLSYAPCYVSAEYPGSKGKGAIDLIVNKFANFLEAQDVFACFGTFDSNTFYELVKNKPFSKKVLIKSYPKPEFTPKQAIMEDGSVCLGVICVK